MRRFKRSGQIVAMLLTNPIFFPLFLLFLNRNLVDSTLIDGEFAFDGFIGADLSLDGMAKIMPNGLLMLTNGTTQMKGHAFRSTPLNLHKTPNGTAIQSFSTSFVFGIIGETDELSTPGMAFVVSGSKNLSTALQSQYLGLLNDKDNGKASNHLFAVELDTSLNVEFEDIDSNHVGVDVNSLKSMKAATAGYYDDKTGAFQNLGLVRRKPKQVWVDYDGEAMKLDVTMAPLEMSKPKRPLISIVVDLSTVIPDLAYIGFSSSTGILFSRHYVLGWSFKLNGMAPTLNASKLPALPLTSPKPRLKAMEIVVPIACVAFVLAVAGTIFFVVRRHLKFAELREDWEVEYQPHRFSYRDLFRATNGFHDKQLLGRGGFGRVYRGVLPTSKLRVAVKRASHESRQGMKEFVTEIVSLGRLRHRNIVQLLGYSRRKDELFLVYDYMSNGSLDKYLYDLNKPVMEWAQRFHIIKGVASGLLYLHENWEQVIIHRDIKASNVLLDSEMNGRLGDFGLARLYEHGTDPYTTHVVGTIGYLAPELGHKGRATPATDVFAYGAFLLEVACGRRPVEVDEHDDQLMLVDWVLENWHGGSVTNVVDPRLQHEYVVEEASLVLKLGLLCSHPLPDTRPSMRQVMQYLDGDIPLPELSPTYLSFSMLDLVQNQGFDECVVSYPVSSSSSNGTLSGLSV